MELSEEIRHLTESKLPPGQFLIDIVASSRQGPKKISVIVDGDEGISIDDCAELSRQLSKALDDLGLIEDNYLLEVSTPGVDHPLKLKRQYNKNIGRRLKVKLHDKIVEGKLTEVDEEKITLTQETGAGKKKETQTMVIPFSSIDKAFVLVSFK
jgi:ribosome maturation factor RimP